MNQTQDPVTGPADPGPRLDRDSVRELNQLRRSRDDRFVAGVAGGLGRHFGIDPTIVRVVLIALTIVGGAGLLLYAAAWLLVPEDGHDRALIPLGEELLKIVLIGVAAVAVLSTLGSGWWWGGHNHGFPWQLGLCLLIVAVVVGYANRRHREDGPVATTAEFSAPTDTAPSAAGPGAPTSSAYVAPRAPSRPPRPRRTGPVLFWPTLALILVGFGVLGLYAHGHHVVASAWPALALAIIGVMLVVGAFVGRPGGLILIGLLAIPPLLGTSAVDNFHWNRPSTIAPATSTDVHDQYRVGNGKTTLDLSQLADPEALVGRTVEVSMGAGDLVVYVPRDLTVEVSGTLRVAGDIEAGGQEQGGLSPNVDTTLKGSDPGAGVLTLDLHGRVGHIEVERIASAHPANPGRNAS
ncbi:MAG TPA: PspC domain-containing protein [Marmoricola sp.]